MTITNWNGYLKPKNLIFNVKQIWYGKVKKSVFKGKKFTNTKVDAKIYIYLFTVERLEATEGDCDTENNNNNEMMKYKIVFEI